MVLKGRPDERPQKCAFGVPKLGKVMVQSVVEGGLSQADAADEFNTTPKTVAK